MGSKGSNTTTSMSSTAPNPQAMQLYQDLLTRAQGVASTPYTPYTGELVAPVNPQQQAGIANINAGAGFAQPYIQNALGLAQGAAQPITQQQIQQYMSPYTQQVVQATQNQFNNQNAQQQQQLLGNAIAQGALGGNRVGITQAELANQQNLAQAPVIANLMNQGYSTGLSTALAEQQAQQAGAYGLGNLGVAGQSAALTGANAQIGAGTLQQQTQQAQDVAQYQQFLNQLGYPFQTTQWLAGIGTGVGSQMGGTSYGTTTGPAPSQFGQIMGGLAGGAGILGSTGAFGASGWLASALPALAAFSDKRVKENIRRIGKLNDGQPIYRFNYKGDPTTHVGLLAQEVEKHHPEAVGDYHGVKTVDYKAATDDAVERWRGGVANYDFGGAVPADPGLGAVPYAGGKSYVPNIGLTAGRLPAANFPKLPQQQGTDYKSLADQAKNLGGLANSIRLGLAGAPDALGSAGNSMTQGAGDFSGSAADPSGGGQIVTPFARGGVADYADGGVPTFDERFTGLAPDGTSSDSSGMGAVLDNFSKPDLNYLVNGAPLAPSAGFPIPQGIAPAPEPTTAPPARTVPSPQVEPTPVSAEGVALPTPQALPRGLRNNNPGNIEDGPFARSQPGYVGSDGRFAIFRSPEEGASASSNLLGAYGNKGINTISGIVNRWAPAADNNDTAAYIRAVSRATGLDPATPLDMSNPALRSKIAQAMFQHENGIPGIGDTLAARNYNRAAGLDLSAATDGSQLPPGAQPTQAKGVANIDWGANSKLWPTLMAAGFGMMASRSPFPGVAIGEGGMQGLQTYQALKQQEQAQTMSQAKIDLEARKLSQEADRYSKEFALKALPYQGGMTATEKATLEQAARKEALETLKPVKIGTDMMGREIYGVRDPTTGSYRRIDPTTGAAEAATPFTSSGPSPLKQAPAAPSQAAPAPLTAAGYTPVAEQPLPEGMEPPAATSTRDEGYLGQVRAQDPRVAETIKGIANYEINPNTLSIRGNRRETILGMVRLYDPSYDASLFPAKQRAVTEFFAGGPNSPAGTLTAGNTAILHLGEMNDMVDNLRGQPGMLNRITDAVGASGIPFLSYAANALRNRAVLGTPEGAALSAFTTARQRFTEEVTKFYAGSQGSEAERDRAIQILDAAKSPEELHEAIKTDIKLMRDKVLQMQGRLMGAMGPSTWKAAVTKDPALVLTYKNSRDTANRILGQEGTAPPAGTAPVAPGAKIPSQADIDYARTHPEVRQRFIQTFGREP